MGILMVGLVKPEVDRHMNKIFSKTEKKNPSYKIRAFKNNRPWQKIGN